MIATDYLRLGVEQYLRELTDTEFAHLVAVVRPPSSTPENQPARKENA